MKIGFLKSEEGSKKVNNLLISTVVLFKFALSFFPSHMVRIKAAHLSHRKSQDSCPIKAYLLLEEGVVGKKALDRLH